MTKDVKFLNSLLNKIGVKGFSFIYENDYLTIKIPLCKNYRSHHTYGAGTWCSLNDLFNNNNYFSHNVWCIKCLINCISETHKANNNLGYIPDYLGINDVGLNFLKCLIDCDSLEELKLRLAIQGY